VTAYHHRPYDVCPDCKKKGVRHHLRARGLDGLSCRYCPWNAYTYSRALVDAYEIRRYWAANEAAGHPMIAWPKSPEEVADVERRAAEHEAILEEEREQQKP
jgi:hypothetical protein